MTLNNVLSFVVFFYHNLTQEAPERITLQPHPHSAGWMLSNGCRDKKALKAAQPQQRGTDGRALNHRVPAKRRDSATLEGNKENASHEA